MATSIQLLRSNIAQLRPDPATLAEGMPMVNLHESEPGLFFRLRDGTLAKVGPVSFGTLAPNSAAQGFAGNSIGEQWVDTSDPASATLKIWDGTQWVVAGGGGTGQKGDQGSKGDSGLDGAKGQKGGGGTGGQKGQTGAQGPKGDEGRKGEKGLAQDILYFEGAVNTPADIPATGNVQGSAYFVISTGTYHAWSGTSWYDVGSITKGEKGEKGREGIKGQKGTVGSKGNTGIKGNLGQQGLQGNAGTKGEKGEIGAKGEKGFGDKGEKGLKGDFVKGDKGAGAAALPALNFKGNVSTSANLPGGAATGDVYFVLDQNTYYAYDGAQWWDIGLISKGEKGLKGLDGNGTKGEKGDASSVPGAAATVDVGTTTTLPSSSQALVTNSGDTANAIFDFDIPKGEIGPKGDFGTVNVGTVTTVSSLVNASVTNVGTPESAILDFDIPKGEKGQKGIKGQKGLKGIKGQKGANGNKGQKGEEGPVAGSQGEVIFNLDGVDPGGDPDFTFDPATNTLATPDIVATGDIEVRNSPQQDGIKLVGRPGGTGDFDVSITPDPLTADRTLVIPDEDGVIVTTGSSDVVTSVMIVDNEILNADINTAAGIEFSKMEALAAGQFIVGDAALVPTAVPMSGDATLSSTGQVDIIDDVDLGGDPTTTTQLTTDNSTKVATTAFVQQRVDEAIQGLDVKVEARAATTGTNITLSTLQTIDGVALAVGDRVLVKDQTNPNDNGIYEAASGAWTRPTDADVYSELVGAFVFVSEGTINVDSGFFCQALPGGVIGSNPIPWTQFSGAGQIIAGGGMTKSGNQLDVNTADPTRIVVNGDDIDLATTAVAAGTYRSVTVDTYGRAVAGANPTTFAGYGLVDTSANLAAVLSDETGTGFAVFSDSPALTGAPTAPTPLAGDNSNKLATTAYVDSAGSNLSLGDSLLYIGNVAGVAVGTAMSGDATINNAGVVTIQPGSITSNKILDGTILTQDIADNQVTTNKILDGSVTTAKIVDQSVTSAKIVDGTIATADLGDDQVTNAKLADASIDTPKLADASVTSAKIVDGTIATVDVADGAITSVKIADGTIQNSDMGANSVSSANIIDGTIDTDDLADAAVTTDKIADGTIVDADVANSTISGGKLVDNIVLGGSPTTSTPPGGDNSTLIATTAFVAAAVLTGDVSLSSGNIFVGDAAGVAQDITMGGDATIDNTGSVTISNNVALGGNPTTTTQAVGDNSTRIATTAYVEAAILTGDLSLNSANMFIGDATNIAQGVAMSGDATMNNAGAITIINSVALAGSPTTTTQLAGDDSTKIATTAYVDNSTLGGLFRLVGGDITPKDNNRNVVPVSDGGATLGTPALRWADVYTQDMHFNNTGTAGNEVDGTTGHWTLQEGRDSLYIINRLTGGRFKLMMQPV